MSTDNQITVLAVSSYEKGHDFMREAKAQGCRVILLTSKSLEDADWPRESIDEIFYIVDKNKEWNMQDVIYGVSYLARTENIDRIVALDDFDVERAASLREHLRVGGMGDTTARYFRDKLAMRMRAREAGIPVPEFLHVLNHKKINEFADKVPFPYMIKPRLLAGSYGLKKVNDKREMWDRINYLADEQSFFLMERFIPGSIYHVDTIISEREVVFGLASKYGTPPFEVAHQGRVFTSQTLDSSSEEAKEVLELNIKVIKALGLLRGVSHSEFIRAEDGKLYFLETSARVGGANLSTLVEAATGVNLWREWAKIEILKGEKPYRLPKVNNDFAAIVTSLSKQEWPDLNTYNDPEVVWRLKKEYHAGLIIKSSSKERINQLVNQYTKRFYNDFFTTAKMGERPSN
ncbi:MAG: ATP-grasp domain-containing protein [Ignavibacteriota bacterium]|nr:ATP-grasp domain-containing protein [Ignavibacteriota bacterium]MBW7842254.1 ATP-grasp domain-containing protein [Ignavibacterium sp.]MCO6448371.1 ATP-grasp domain-containing protein [Ignavibacterium album]MCZ2270099.1 ATP-grasp domain-containing protein [Ignavibacteriales bacterium]HOJ08772.1 ATP-grasp domain-containing protein [Ignavibacteriaceae bacterium]